MHPTLEAMGYVDGLRAGRAAFPFQTLASRQSRPSFKGAWVQKAPGCMTREARDGSAAGACTHATLDGAAS